jgi:hypothetical protein
VASDSVKIKVTIEDFDIVFYLEGKLQDEHGYEPISSLTFKPDVNIDSNKIHVDVDGGSIPHPVDRVFEEVAEMIAKTQKGKLEEYIEKQTLKGGLSIVEDRSIAIYAEIIVVFEKTISFKKDKSVVLGLSLIETG